MEFELVETNKQLCWW